MTPSCPPPAHWKVRLICHPIVEWMHFSGLCVLFGCRLENVPDLPEGAPVIFAGNHGSHFDFLFLLEGLYGDLKRHVRGVAWDQMADIPVVRLLFYAYEGIPVSEGKNAQALRKMVQVLRSGTDLWVQCEGAPYDALAPFHPGAAIAALMSGSAIIPFSLRGVQPLFKKLPWPNRIWGRVSIRFHQPLYPQPYLDKFTELRTAAEQMTADLRAAVASGIDYPDGMANSVVTVK
jgi:1-acyl-sn-glycerol-3-phosphate acyltransferase